MKNLLFRVVCIAVCVVFLGCFCTACGKNENADNIGADISKTEDKISEITDNANKSDVGSYVLASENDFSYENVDGGVAITSYTGEETAIIIPEKIKGHDVLELRNGTFADIAIVGVRLPNTLKLIGDSAFYFCGALKEVELGNSVMEIDNEAFVGCFALSRIKLNEGLTRIGELAFGNNTSLKSIELPSSLKVIDNGAFCMSALTSIRIPKNVEVIGKQAFASCAQLKQVEIEDGVKVIVEEAFQTCQGIKEIIIPNSVTEIGNRAFGQIPNLTIYGTKGSVAENYAAENGILFKEF